MYWLGDENDSWFEKKQAVSPLLFIFSVVTIFFSVSDSSVYIVAEFRHCSIKTERALHEFTSQLNPYTTSCFSSPFMK